MMRNATKYRSLRLIILSLAGMLATAVHAQEASLNGNVLSIPMVAVGNQYYRVDPLDVVPLCHLVAGMTVADFCVRLASH